MSIVADKVACRCSMKMDECFETIQWNDKHGNIFMIRNVPTLRCIRPECEEEYRSAYVQLNVSMIADEIRNGHSSKIVEYIKSAPV